MPRTWLKVALLQADGGLTFLGSVAGALTGLSPQLKKRLDAALGQMRRAIVAYRQRLVARQRAADR